MGSDFMWDWEKSVFMCDDLFLFARHITGNSTKGARMWIRSICLCG